MDPTTRDLATFSSNLSDADLPTDVVHEAKRRLIDTLGCAVGGFDSPPARIARAWAGTHRADPGSRVLGVRNRVIPESAAFVNAVTVRYLDFNDSYASSRVSGGHPSDTIPAVLAVADASRATGQATVRGIVAGYQANAAVPIPFKQRGWDQGITTAVGATVGIGALLGQTTETIANAVSLAITSSVPLRVTRSGELSMWKGCATAAAGRNAVFASLLAMRGMIGPGEPFEGRHGFWEQVSGPFELELDPAKHGFWITRADTKLFPIEGGMQAVLPVLLELSNGIAVDEIEAIDVRTYWGLWFEAASEPAKWDPRTRETADHSLPFVMAVALRDRGVSERSFREASIQDQALRPLMARIRVVEDPELTGPDPTLLGPTEITITTRDGDRHTAWARIARGHHSNPMTDAELDRKFRDLVEPWSGPARCADLLGMLWALDRMDDVSVVLDAWSALIDPDGPGAS